MLYTKYLLLVLLLSIHLSCGEDPASAEDKIDTVTDVDGNVYKTIKIGDQLWMTENLKTTHYRNGDEIPNIIHSSQWKDMSYGAYCSYNNTESYIDDYGLLYNWYAVNDDRKIAPSGWHVPTDEEWKELEMHLGMARRTADSSGWRGSLEGNGLKSAAKWGGSDVSGFMALPGGYRGSNNGLFYSEGDVAYFWSSTMDNSVNAWVRILGSVKANVGRFYLGNKHGTSIRCVKD